MNLGRLRSVRWRTTVAATVLTALVLGLASVLIVRLVERDLEDNARSALSGALESASHSVSGEGSTGTSEGGGGEQHGQQGAAEGGSTGDAQQQALADASIREVEAGVDAASNALLIIVPAVVVALGLAIWWTVGRALRPVRDISAQVAEISGTTLSERVPVPASKDEIAELAALMNEMLDRLESSSERQRAFVADASHELRSPLSTIVAAAEIASVSPDPIKLQRLADTVSGEAERMQLLVADLLDLARLDEDRLEVATTEVDVVSVCRDALHRLEDAAPAISLSAPEVAHADGVLSQIERVVFNLAENAVTHAEGRVEITVTPDGADVLIAVEDDGPGVSPEDRERIFERFVRLDSSRGRATGGIGIGLALVKAIVDRHRGTIGVGDSAALGGARFEVTLPAAKTPA
ncbi:MAG: HAMP domain-containing histidine kinase [Acidimicrobiia bacterium]|nr:HAMP domain-containing histidine kinase [Acidimicrobiia bacterium]MCY4434158.1 HAMP domain-containing sensor histidine kinase [bacterium]